MKEFRKSDGAIPFLLGLMVIFMLGTTGYAIEGERSLLGGVQEQESEFQKEAQEPAVRKATPEQARLVRTCIKSSQKIREVCRAMFRMIHSPQISIRVFRERANELFNHMEKLETADEKFMESLSEDQESGIKERIEKMDEIHEKAKTHVEEMQEELGKKYPDKNHLIDIAEDLMLEMEDWQNHYKNIAVDMDIKLIR